MFSRKNSWNFIFLFILVILIFTPIRTYINQFFLIAPTITATKVENKINLNSLNLPLKGINVESKKLNELKGKVVFLNFFGTWCPPCIAEMPSIQKLYESKGKDIEFVLIPINDDIEKVKSFLKDNHYTIPVYEADDVIDSSIKPKVFPTVIIFDKNGNLVSKHESASDWNSDEVHEFIDKLSL